MLHLFKKKKNTCQLLAPISGYTIPLEKVKDPVFAQKMMGDGIAIQSTGDTVVAPAEGEICLIPPTKHAIGIKLKNGEQILIHVGMDTVELQGEGFTQLVETGAHVQAGTPLLKIDRKLIESKGLSLETPMILINYTDYEILATHIEQEVIAGESVVIEYR